MFSNLIYYIVSKWGYYVNHSAHITGETRTMVVGNMAEQRSIQRAVVERTEDEQGAARREGNWEGNIGINFE